MERITSRERLAGAAGWVAGAAIVTLIATGGYAYYNTNILNHDRTGSANEDNAADLEKRFGKYLGMPQPVIEDMKLEIALFPDERRAVTKGATGFAT